MINLQVCELDLRMCSIFDCDDLRNKHLKLRQEVINHFVSHLWKILQIGHANYA